jgi:hypothetical protein
MQFFEASCFWLESQGWTLMERKENGEPADGKMHFW